MPPLAARSELCCAELRRLPPTEAPDASTTCTGCRRGIVESTFAVKTPFLSVACGIVYRSRATLAPTTGLPPRTIRPLTAASFELAAFHKVKGTAPPLITMRGDPPAAAAAVRAGLKPASLVTGCAVEETFESERFPPGSEKTIIQAATPPFDEVGVPPTVTATYSLPPDEKIVGPLAIGRVVS